MPVIGDRATGRGSRTVRHLLVAIAVLGVGSSQALAQRPKPPKHDQVVKIMTRNVYHGVGPELAAATTATSLTDFMVKAAAVYQGYHTRDFPERAAALAAEIEAQQPDLIGLQEAVLIRTQYPADGAATPAGTVDLDFVEILLDALEARRLHYEVVVQAAGWDIEVPTALGFDVRHTDREVILARSDGRGADLELWNAQGGQFISNCAIPTAALGTLTIRRSWVSVDASSKEEEFRMISTHLDGDCLPITPAFQRAQAKELLAGPALTDLPLILVGDLNSPGDNTGVAYQVLINGGFSDAWLMAGSGSALTCCQAGDVLNVHSALDRRIDFVLFRGDLLPLSARVVGDDPSDRTPSGLWPSDHAGVAAALALPRAGANGHHHPGRQ